MRIERTPAQAPCIHNAPWWCVLWHYRHTIGIVGFSIYTVTLPLLLYHNVMVWHGHQLVQKFGWVPEFAWPAPAIPAPRDYCIAAAIACKLTDAGWTQEEIAAAITCGLANTPLAEEAEAAASRGDE